MVDFIPGTDPAKCDKCEKWIGEKLFHTMNTSELCHCERKPSNFYEKIRKLDELLGDNL